MIYRSTSLEETREIAKKFLQTLISTDKAVTVSFFGDLGAGKTTFIQALAKEMGIGESTTSPTFVIQKTYSAKKIFDTLVHIDAYRLGSGEDLLKLRFDETLMIPHSLICVEWPENVLNALPLDSHTIICRFIDETTHEYEF